MGLRLVSELQTMKRCVLAVSCLFLASAAYATDADIVRFDLEGVSYCVPKALIVDESPGWIPRNLPDDGFVFFVPKDQLSQLIPQKDRLGRRQAFTAYVASTKAGNVDASRKVLADRAKVPGASLKDIISLNLVFAYEARRGDHWIAWRLPKGVPPSVEALGKVGVPVATCSKPSGSIDNPSWKGSEATCRRSFQLDALRLGYSMDARNLDRVEWLDKRIRETVSSWRCEKSKRPGSN